MLFLGVKPKVSHKWFRKTICSVDIILRWGCSQLDFKNRFAAALFRCVFVQALFQKHIGVSPACYNGTKFLTALTTTQQVTVSENPVGEISDRFKSGLMHTDARVRLNTVIGLTGNYASLSLERGE